MTFSVLVAFVGNAALAYVTPGPDWFVVVRNAARSRRAGLISGVGVSCGLLVHMTAAAVGVAALLLSSAEAFTALKLIGAAYLVYFAFAHCWRRVALTTGTPTRTASRIPGGRCSGSRSWPMC